MKTYDVNSPTIGQKIKAGMQSMGLTVPEFAEMINCNRSNVYDIFRRRSIDSELLCVISKVLHRNYLLEMALDLEEDLNNLKTKRN